MEAADTEWKKHKDITRNTDSNIIKAKVSHFSYYAVFGSSESPRNVAYPKACLITGWISSAGRGSEFLRMYRDRSLLHGPGRRAVEMYYRLFGG